MPTDTDTSELVAYLTTSINGLAGPLREIREAEREWGHKLDVDRTVLDALLLTAAYFSRAQDKPDGSGAAFSANVIRALFHGNSGFPPSMLEKLIRESMVAAQQTPSVPLLIEYLKIYDGRKGTHASHIAKAMLYRLADSICKQRYNVSVGSEDALSEFYRILYE